MLTKSSSESDSRILTESNQRSSWQATAEKKLLLVSFDFHYWYILKSSAQGPKDKILLVGIFFGKRKGNLEPKTPWNHDKNMVFKTVHCTE